MKIRTRVGIAAALGVAAILGLTRHGLSADEAKLVGDKDTVTKLIEADIAELQKALSAAKPEKRDLKRAKVLAVVIALNAQAVGGDKAGVAAGAGKIAAALAKDDALAEAKEAAKALSSGGGSGEPGDVVKMALFDADPTVNHWDYDLTMQLFKTPRAGGLGIESKIKAWAEKAPAGKEAELAVGFAQKSAVLGLILQKMSPPMGKPAADWIKLAKDMETASEEALAAAAMKDGKSMMAAFGKVDKACTVCHEKYK